MTRTRRKLSLALAFAAAALTTSLPVTAGAGNTTDRSAKPMTTAVIGDVPYGAAQEARFGDFIDAVNDDPKVRAVVHVGDIKSGSTTCSDERFAAVRGAFDTFKDPVVYTPGDNEWTDCHRAAAGAYLPTERLASLRDIFYPEPGRTLGGRERQVNIQADFRGFEDYVENQMWLDSKVVFSTVHVVGSNNGLAPWFGAAETEMQFFII